MHARVDKLVRMRAGMRLMLGASERLAPRERMVTRVMLHYLARCRREDEPALVRAITRVTPIVVRTAQCVAVAVRDRPQERADYTRLVLFAQMELSDLAAAFVRLPVERDPTALTASKYDTICKTLTYLTECAQALTLPDWDATPRMAQLTDEEKAEMLE